MIEMTGNDQSLQRFTRKVILITGASGIGEATARRALNEGATVFLAALNAGSLAEELQCGFYEGDLADEQEAARAVQSCLSRHGHLDGLFNIAGISGRRFGDGPLHECTAEGWDTLMRVNVRSTFLITREVLRHMLATGKGGAIVNTASVLATSPEPQFFATHAYAAGKGAILSMTTSAAAYYATRSIRINAIAPGLVKTPMSRRAQDNPQIQEFIRTKQALAKGFVSAEDVAAAALFLLSDDSRHITGEVLTIDGGWRFGS